MKFIQLNLWRGNLKHNLVEYLKKENADILNLQEVTGGLDSKFYYFSLYDKLKRELNYKYDFYLKTVEGKFYGKSVSEGYLMLTKYPIIYTNAFFIGGKPKKNSMFNHSDTNVRAVQHAKVNADGEIINLLNYQGYFIWGSKNGNRITQSHCRKILDYMKSIDPNEKIILSGDFNLAPRSKSLEMINKHYSDLVLKYNIKTTRNELSNPKEPVDNIFVNDKVKVRSLKVPKVYVSDHLPLIMDFK